jgi:hypothetical protein
MPIGPVEYGEYVHDTARPWGIFERKDEQQRYTIALVLPRPKAAGFSPRPRKERRGRKE